MKINVTRADIVEAKQNNASMGTFIDKFGDPITIAAKKALKARRVMTHSFTVEADGIFYDLSQEAIDFQNQWCKGVVGQPFTFSITERKPTSIV